MGGRGALIDPRRLGPGTALHAIGNIDTNVAPTTTVAATPTDDPRDPRAPNAAGFGED